MSQDRSRRGRQKAKAPAAGKGPTKGPVKGATKSVKQKQSRKPSTDARRPFWANEAAEAETRALVGTVVAAQDPTALVRSLGSPPLNKFSDNAQHYYAVVYQKSQRFAVAMATASGVLVTESGADPDPGADPEPDPGAATH